MKAIFFGILFTLSSLAASAQTAQCPSKAQKIKVIDLKSGWWQGDGGDTDRYVIDHITKNCPNVSFSYEHTLYGSFGSFGSHKTGPSVEVTEFDQIWLLSGGEADGADIRLDSAEFQKYLKLMTSGRSNLFIGTGFGNIYHANALTNDLGLGSLLVTDRAVHEYPSPEDLTVVSELNLSSVQQTHPLLKGISILPHLVNLGGFTAPSDWLAVGPSVQSIATDADGKTVIGETSVNGRKIIIDANLARTYLIRKSNVTIQNYLLNLVSALEN